MKITRSKFVGACHECGEPSRNQIDFHWAGITIRLCDRHMLIRQTFKTKPTKPKKEIY